MTDTFIRHDHNEFFHLIHDLKRIHKYNKTFNILSVKIFLTTLNTVMFNFIHPNHHCPIFSATSSFEKMCLAVYCLHQRKALFYQQLIVCNRELNYFLKFTQAQKRQVDLMQQSIRYIEDRLYDRTRPKSPFSKSFDYFNPDQVLEGFKKARRDMLGNPKADSPSWQALMLFYAKCASRLHPDLIGTIQRKFTNGELSFFDNINVMTLIDVMVEEVRARPLEYLEFFKKNAAEDESHQYEPGDWYLNPHPSIMLRDKILESLQS